MAYKIFFSVMLKPCFANYCFLLFEIRKHEVYFSLPYWQISVTFAVKHNLFIMFEYGSCLNQHFYQHNSLKL